MSKKPPQPVPQVPQEEEEELPKEIGPICDPSFHLVLGHLIGHTFLIEEQPKDTDGEAPATLREFDPRAFLTAYTKNGDELAKRIVVVEREEIQALALAEEESFSSALRKRLQKERSARIRAKRNAAKRRVIAAYEAEKAEAADAAAAAAAAMGITEPSVMPPSVSPGPGPCVEATISALMEEGSRADFTLLLKDYPINASELQDLNNADFSVEGLVDLWAVVYLAGETLNESAEKNSMILDTGDVGTCAPFAQPRLRVECEPPEAIHLFYDGIHNATVGSDLANCTVCTHGASHELAFPTNDTSVGEHIQSVIIELLTFETLRRGKFNDWIKSAEVVQIPDMTTESVHSESRFYRRMMDSIHPSHHDVPLFLHCLTEQVEQTLSGHAQQREDEVAQSRLTAYLASVRADVLTDGPESIAPKKIGLDVNDSWWTPLRTKVDGLQPVRNLSVVVGECTLLQHSDLSMSRHYVGQGEDDVNGEKVVDVVRKVVDQVEVIGARRVGLPLEAVHSPAQRQCLRSHIYPFAPGVPVPTIEQFLFVHAFETLMRRAQPEQTWCLKDRTFRERIPSGYWAQTLEVAFRCEPFVSTTYLPRHDCLLIALHRRTPAGRVVWHSWRGDLFTSADSSRWRDGLYTVPTFTDWVQVFGGGVVEVPQPRFLLGGFDSRKLGYVSVIEKLATPADGSAVIVSRLEGGLRQSFPMPPKLGPQPTAIEMEDLVDRGTFMSDLGDSSTSSRSVFMPFREDVQCSNGGKFNPPPYYSSRLARMMKDGLAFGLVVDDAWMRCQEGNRRNKLAAATTPEDVVAMSPVVSLPTPDATNVGRVESPLLSARLIGADRIDKKGKLPFRDAKFGLVWFAFPDGSRCTARMHVERLDFQSDAAKPPPLGVLATYTCSDGQAIQVPSDGTVRLTSPLELRKHVEAPSTKCSLPSGAAQRFMPGCPEDIEVVRTVTPLGVVIRRLLSGRSEVFHPDGVIAWRNPTGAELQVQLEDLKHELSVSGSQRIEFLEALCMGCETNLSTPASERDRTVGFPGHWVVVHPNGRMHGRRPANKLDALEVGSGSTGHCESSADICTPHRRASPSAVQDLFGGVLVDDAAMIEYDIMAAAAAEEVDLNTNYRKLTNQCGLSIHEDGESKVYCHVDGTRVERISEQDCTKITILKEGFPRIKCILSTRLGKSEAEMSVECADGTLLEVVPYARGCGINELEALCTKSNDFFEKSAHATLMLRHRGGFALISTGFGEIEILTGLKLVPEDGIESLPSPMSIEACRAANKQSCIARCDEGVLRLCDDESNVFELFNNQALSVSSALSTDDTASPEEPPSPRCPVSEQAYFVSNPNPSFHVPPQNVAPPRLFVVYGDGEVDELLTAAEAQEVLHIAHNDNNTTVVEDNPLDSPMEVCRCHTIFRSGHANSLSSPSTPKASDLMTQYRHLIEYPDVSEEMWQKLHGMLKQYRTWEEQRHAKLRPAPKERKKEDTGPRRKTPARSKRTRGRRADLCPALQAVEEVPEPVFLEELNLSEYQHAAQAFDLRKNAAVGPCASVLLERALKQLRETEGVEEMDAERSSAEAVVHFPADEDCDKEEELEGDAMVQVSIESPNHEPSQNLPVPRRFCFNYFRSAAGHKFLGKQAELCSSSQSPKSANSKAVRSRKKGGHDVWNPRLVGEPVKNSGEDVVDGTSQAHIIADVGRETDTTSMAKPACVTVGHPRSVVATSQLRPVGGQVNMSHVPRPDTRSQDWDIYGNPRPSKLPQRHAQVSINAAHLAVEGIDSRVRTVSTRENNSRIGPSAALQRKTGPHALKHDGSEVLSEVGLLEHETQLKVSAAMQGLGDSGHLIDVTPGACHFGPLRQGAVYRMTLRLRNLGVDVMRFRVCPMENEHVRVWHPAGQLAPGMATTLSVEVAASTPTCIEDVLVVKTKSHEVRVLVAARVVEAAEYDALDAESVLLHHRHVGHYQGSTEHKKQVELVVDQAYSRRVLGGAYLKLATNVD